MTEFWFKVANVFNLLVANIFAILALPFALLFLFVGVKGLLTSAIAIIDKVEVEGSFSAGAVYGGVVTGPLMVLLALWLFRLSFRIFKRNFKKGPYKSIDYG
ncbi:MULTISPECIES: hypothetical protein [Corallincola]|uniref:Uncharacterized protein n=2 Tax=Corallincola TaxID=1775176 RepID=A0ABY1WMG7_9GAMM|nr:MULTISPECIES: hypothetical protein [Corallincola]TAA42704.1 hypothetical protein EXY25_15575 [Corallincola spongiicola]TCI01645.1 hypothetical protein EZV61_16875 [Corallincola luteus]